MSTTSQQAHAEIDARQFRNALGSFATGVTIVTTRDTDGTDIGLTANSFNSVSLDPPMVLWSLAKSSYSLPAFLRAQYFAVHILAADQQPLSEKFAKRGADKFAGLKIERGAGGVPLIDGCSAQFECHMAFRHDGGDHEILVGDVLKFSHFDRPPLIFHSGRYGLVVEQQAKKAGAEENNSQTEVGPNYLGLLLGTVYHQMFMNVRAELAKRNMTQAEYYALSALCADGDRSIDELGQIVTFVGHALTPEVIAKLESHGFVQRKGDILTPTGAGRQEFIELLAIAKAAESDAESALDYSESQLLKQLLRRILNQSKHKPPKLLRRR